MGELYLFGRKFYLQNHLKEICKIRCRVRVSKNSGDFNVGSIGTK
jgi:hypothetical protein